MIKRGDMGLAGVRILLISFLFFGSCALALAQTPKVTNPTVPVGGAPAQAKVVTGVAPGQMIQDYYNLALMIGGVLAFGAIVYGAIRYTVAAGNPSGQSDARDQITQALVGLIVLLGVYTILNVINPELTHLNLPRMQPVEGSLGTFMSACQPADVQKCVALKQLCSTESGSPTCVSADASPPGGPTCTDASKEECTKKNPPQACAVIDNATKCVPQTASGQFSISCTNNRNAVITTTCIPNKNCTTAIKEGLCNAVCTDYRNATCTR